VAANQRQYAAHDHGVLGPGWPFAGAQHGSHQRTGLTIKNHQRQIARTAVMVVVKRQWLLAVGRVFGMVQVEHEMAWWAGKAGDELLDQGLADPINVLAADRVFKARHRRRRRQRSAGIERQAASAKLEHRVVSQTIGIVAVFVAAADLVDPLRQQVALGMGDVAGMPGIDHSCSKALGQADLAIDAAQQQRAKVGRQATPCKIGADRVAWNGCKSELF